MRRRKNLHGDEKEWIVRHAGLWAKERDREVAGRPGRPLTVLVLGVGSVTSAILATSLSMASERAGLSEGRTARVYSIPSSLPI